MAKNWFLAGIGGAGMAPLAIYLSQGRDRVFGFDDHLSPEISLLLRRQNVQILPRPAKIPACDALIYNRAFSPEDPLFLQAKSQKIPSILRGNFLANFLSRKKLVAIIGSHGKTSTTACIIRLLEKLKFPHDYLLGGFFRNGKLPAQNAHNEWVIAEIDESDGTISAFHPEITLAINLEMDHEIYYDSELKLLNNIRKIFSQTRQRIFINSNSQFLEKIRESNPKFRPIKNDSLISKHDNNYFNVINYNMAFTIANYLLSHYKIKPTCENLFAQYAKKKNDFILPDVVRRQELIFQSNDLIFMADYAHHPTEIRAFLAGKSLENTLVVFQPHRYSRTQFHWGNFLDVLQNIPNLTLLPVYDALENFSHEFDSHRLQRELAARGSNAQIIQLEGLSDHLTSKIGEKHFSKIYFIGAGNIFSEAQKFAKKWRQEKFYEACIQGQMTDSISKNLSLKSLCTMRIGGNAAFYAEPANENELSQIRQLAQSLQMPTFLLGKGSNLLIDDEGFEGLILRLKGAPWETCEFQKEGIFCGAGLPLQSFCRYCMRREIGGFEFLSGIPGSIGGAMISNAGAHGQSIGDFVQEIHYLDENQRLIVDQNPQFSYRHGHFPSDAWITRLRLNYPGVEKKSEEIRQIQRNFARERQQKQPANPNAGSIFKNPPGHFAGKLIEDVGLKGKCSGGAQISPIHGNFIINCDNATAADVLELIFLAKRTVRERFSIDLETEIRYLSNVHCGPL